MLRHMCPPLGLGKRCPARVAYKVRKDPTSSPQSPYGCRVGRGREGFSGFRDPSAQRGVNFSVVVVSLVLFLLPFFVEKWGWAGRCCGVV